MLAVLIMGIINGVIIEKGEAATFINNDVFRGFTLVFMDRRLITDLNYCFNISVCDITEITAVAIQYLILKKNNVLVGMKKQRCGVT
ncbi:MULTISPECIES: hypothetical protein [unclassified Bacillus (in: firmicutes)]|uniref:hypothetical protein n=1 Tax=unclassified Bacillus (in: firmicutes) TaxID=185979 RepID=UPI003D199DFA